MKLAIYLQALLDSVCCLISVLVKGECNQDPEEICVLSTGVGVVVTPDSLSCLVKILEKTKVKRAYVYGWVNHRIIMVLDDTGSLTPYHNIINKADYAFCALKQENKVSNCNLIPPDNQYQSCQPKQCHTLSKQYTPKN